MQAAKYICPLECFQPAKIQPLLGLITTMMKYFYVQFCTVNFLPIVAKEQKYGFLIDVLYCIWWMCGLFGRKSMQLQKRPKMCGLLVSIHNVPCISL